MYDGNMGDFVFKLNTYLKKQHSCKLTFGHIPEVDRYYIAFFADGQPAAMGYEVFDTEDFEQQVYDFVNKELEDVQGQYDGLPKQFEDLFGDDLSTSEDEDFQST